MRPDLGSASMRSKKPKRRGGAAQKRMVDGVLPAVGAAVAGVVDQLAPILRIRIGDDVVVLEIVGGGPDRQVVVDVRLLAQHAAHVGQEVRLVPVADLAAEVERDVGSLELVEAGAESARGIDRHFRGGELAQLVADGAEVGLDLARLALAGRRQSPDRTGRAEAAVISEDMKLIYTISPQIEPMPLQP